MDPASFLRTQELLCKSCLRFYSSAFIITRYCEQITIIVQIKGVVNDEGVILMF
jgi:hypothetical protein